MTAWKIVAVEWLKVRKRAAFWVCTLSYFGLLTLGFLITYRAQVRLPERQHFSLPGDWSQVLPITASVGGFLVLILVVLLTASEKTWRTERQNVIDGLSRNQYFLGKLLLLLGVALFLWAGTIIITSTFGLLFRSRAPVDAPLIDALSAKLLLGLLVRFLYCGAIAFCFALISSGSGTALAFAVLFLVLQAPVFELMMLRGGVLAHLVRFLPDRIVDSLTSTTIWDPERLARANEQARAFAQQMNMPEHGRDLFPPSRALAIAAAYLVLFSGIGWWSVRRRDL